MDREIKFRAWDKATCSMIGSGAAWKLYLDGGSAVEGVWATSDLVLMQYTGLKDKNGVEIYEGDLIENERGRTARVAWHNYTAGFDCTFVNQKEGCPTIPATDRHYGLEPNNWERLASVVGNIHEHPELLEIKQ